MQQPYSASRLPNGNTLVACLNPGKVIELNRAGRVVREHKTDIKIPTDLLHFYRLVFVGKGSVACDNEQPGDLGQVSDDVFGDAIAEILLGPVAAKIGERQHDDEGASRWRRRRPRAHRQAPLEIRTQARETERRSATSLGLRSFCMS